MRGFLLHLWNIVDPFYYFFSRLITLPCKEGEKNILRIRLTTYKGRPVVLSDGTEINKNDKLVKIHLHNVKLIAELRSIESEWRKAKILYRYMKQSLPGVEWFIRNHKKSNEIKGIIGISLLHRGSEKLGFEVFDIKNPLYLLFKRFALLPIELLSTENFSFQHHLRNYHPCYLFMSKETLTTRYRADFLDFQHEDKKIKLLHFVNNLMLKRS